MNKYKKLLNNTLIFAIGNFGSKFINFFLVPLQTYYLTTSEFGKVDVYLTTLSLFLPILSLNISDATLRFIKEDPKNNFCILKNAFFIVKYSIIIILLPCIFVNILLDNYLYSLLFLLLGLQVIQLVLDQYTRAVDRIKQYALNGILMSFSILISNLIFLNVLKWSMVGIIVSLIISNLISIIYFLIINTELRNNSSMRDEKVSKTLLIRMLKYSLPLTPNMIMWWFINGSTRFFIIYFISSSSNGLFAVANKIPSLLTLFTSIFAQAWQLSAMEESDSNDNNVFYSETFNFYYSLLFIICSLVLVFSKVVVYLLVPIEYFESWKLVPVLLLAAVYSSLSAFTGSIYTAFMHTKGVLVSSILGAVLTLVCNAILIPIIGLPGAGLGTLVSFIGMFVMRLLDTRKYIIIEIDTVPFIFSNIIYIIQCLVILFISNSYIMYSIEMILFLIILFINRITTKRIIREIIVQLGSFKNKITNKGSHV